MAARYKEQGVGRAIGIHNTAVAAAAAAGDTIPLLTVAAGFEYEACELLSAAQLRPRNSQGRQRKAGRQAGRFNTREG